MTKEWAKLSAARHSQIRTEMYFGSRALHTQRDLSYSSDGVGVIERSWVPAVYTAFREIIDNAIDEMVAKGFGNKLNVTYDPETMTISVSDNGRGIPIDFDETEQKYAATVLLSETLAGRNFGDDRGDTRGMNGIGASVVNFCSDWFKVKIERDDKVFEQTFQGGEEHVAEAPLILPAIPDGNKKQKTGTKITFKLSPKVFPDLTLPLEFVVSRLTEVALCYPKLMVTLNREPIIPKLDQLFPEREVIRLHMASDEESFRVKHEFWLVPGFTEEEMVHTTVNAIPMFNGGTHVEAFKKGFYAGMLNALERESKKRKLSPNRSDIADGMLIYGITQMAEPSFDGQSKTRLINEGVAITIIRRALDDPETFKKLVKAHPNWIEQIFARCAARTRQKDSETVAKEARRNLRTKVENLSDACGNARQRCILMLAEGLSAISGLVEARDPDIHGGLPLRGKPMNVRGRSLKEIMANEPLRNIMNAIGLIPGQKAVRSTLRYGQVYLTCDADEDGKNICALLVNFFHALWPELLDPEKPFLYIFDTPLIIATKGKQRRYWFNDNIAKFDEDALKGWTITRAKGLAALQREDWRHALEKPKLLPVVDDGNLSEALSLLFDDRADARKEWIGM